MTWRINHLWKVKHCLSVNFILMPKLKRSRLLIHPHFLYLPLMKPRRCHGDPSCYSNNHLSPLERMRACAIIILHQKNQESHYESWGWYHYTCLHSNCPLNIVLLQQHVFIISEHPNGSNIIRTRLMAWLCFVRVCLIRAGPLMVY